MKKITLVAIVFGVFLGVLGMTTSLCAPASSSAPHFSGHYELMDEKGDRSFSLDITQTGSKADLSFSAGMADGSGAAPDGDGQGKINSRGILSFTFKDSFDNEGSGTFESRKDGYHLHLNATKVVEPRPLRFYGDLLLKKTSGKSQ
ncbi:MAG TPA: hypothetical protein VGC39_04965 [Candidatus Methylacidiphilales bacterium]